MVAGRKDTLAGERMKSIRQSRHLTQDQLAKAAGVSRSLVAQWETGRSGFAGKAAQIAKALEVPVRLLRPEIAVDPNAAGGALTKSAQEQALVEAFRQLPADDQACLVYLATRMSGVM